MAIQFHSRHPNWVIVLLTILTLLTVPSKAAVTINSAGFTLTNTVVHSTTQMKIYATPSTTIPAAGTITVLFPAQITVAPSSSCTLTTIYVHSFYDQFAIQFGQTVETSISVTCSVSTSGFQYLLTATIGSQINSFFQITLASFTNPAATTITDSIQLLTYSGSTILDQQITGLQIVATVDALTSQTLSSSSDIVGNSPSTLTVTIVNKNAIPADGKIYIDFPYWNPQATSNYVTMVNNDASFACTALTNIQDATCSFSSTTQRMTMASPFTAIVPAGTSISFSVYSIKNPIDPVAQSGFVISTGDSQSGLIDQGTGSLQVKTQTVITSSSVYQTSSIVQAYTQYVLTFSMPVPLNPGCLIYVSFPAAEIVLDSQLTSATGQNLFGAARTLSGATDTAQNQYQIYDGCDTYLSNNNAAVITFSTIQNPFYVQTTTGTIEVFVYDANLETIATTNNNGPTVTTTASAITVSTLEPDYNLVNLQTNLLFTIQPEVSAYAASTLTITMPTAFTLPAACVITPVTTTILNTAISCTISAQVIEISDLFTADYTYSATQSLQFKIDSITLPGSAKPPSPYVFLLETEVAGTDETLSTSSLSDLFTALQGILKDVLVTPNSASAAELTSYQFSVLVTDPVLQGGIVKVVIPSDITFSPPSAGICSNFGNGLSSSGTCSYVSSGNYVLLENAFPTAYTDTTTYFTFSINNFQNPRSVTTSSSFEVYTMDSEQYLINEKTSGITVTMTSAIAVTAATVEPLHSIVGMVTNYTFYIKSPSALYTGDILLLTFPSSLSKPLSSTLDKCVGITLDSNLTCRALGQYVVQVNVTLAPGQTVYQANQEFQLKINGVQNPGTTKPTGSFQVSIYDSHYYLVNSNNANFNNFYVTMTYPGNFTKASVAHASFNALEATQFTFVLQIANPFPANGSLVITVPQQLTIDPYNMNCSTNIADSTPVCTPSYIKNLNNITITEISPTELSSGTTIILTLNGLINSRYAEATDSFIISSFTSEGYTINQNNVDLTVTNNCDYPCFTCLSHNQSSVCTSCDKSSKFLFLIENQCVAYCPSGQFNFRNESCQECDSQCSACNISSSDCTGCKKGYFLLGNSCERTCPDGYVKNREKNTCDLCESPCQSCQRTTTQCTGCLLGSEFPYFYQKTCLASCPANISVDLFNECLPCEYPCQTCQALPQVCTSCPKGLKWNKKDMTCVESCPSGTADYRDVCEVCNTNCLTCSKYNHNICTSCSFPLSLHTESFSCLEQCPVGTVQVTSNSQNQCQPCAKNCLACQDSIDYCTKCTPQTVFSDFSCVKNCPANFTRLSEERNICIRSGLVCDYGYAINDTGQCDLAVQQCSKGYILNREKDKCIPVPGVYIPALFLILNLGWTIYILVQAKKFPAPKEVIISQLLLCYTTLQSITCVILFCLAIWLNYPLIIGLHLLVVSVMVLSNLTVSLVLELKVLPQDKTFHYWTQEYKKTVQWYLAASSIVSFKLIRGFYSKAFKNNVHFNAQFDDTYQSVVLPLFVATVINFTLQMIPLIIVDIYTLMFIPWGYEIMVLSIDSLIMSLVIFALEIVEFTLYKKKQSEPPENYKGVKHLSIQDHQSVLAVKSGIMYDEESRDAILVKNSYPYDNYTKGETEDPQKKKKITQDSDPQNEVQLLEDLIRRLKEERKFNDLQVQSEPDLDDNEEDDTSIPPQGSHRNQQKKEASILTNEGKKQLVQNIRENIENKIQGNQSSRQMPSFGRINLNQSIQPQNFGAYGSKIVENLESARTEKFNQYQQKDSITISQQASPSKKQQSVLLSNESEQNEQDFNDREIFMDEFREVLDDQYRKKEIYVRDWYSYDDNIMREWYDDFGPESDFEDQLSAKSFPRMQKDLNDVGYRANLELYRERLKSQNQYNNLYIERQDQMRASRDQKFTTRRTQTFDKDVNYQADEFNKDDNFVFDDQEENQIPEIEPNLTSDLINNVILNMSEESENHISVSQKSQDLDYYNSQRNHLKTKKKLFDPNFFEIDDIMGVFDIDDYGNMIFGGKEERRRDNFNRKVNKHGYLIDHNGNIINQDGQVIFEYDELDEDEDIPVPYRFDQRKKQLLQTKDKFILDPQDIENRTVLDDESLLKDEEEKVNEELEKLKKLSRDPSADSKLGQSPSQNLEQNKGGLLEDEDMLDQRKKKLKGTKREREMARAYGGDVPQEKSAKKIRQSKQSDDKHLQRIDTDKMFPSLWQEEERVRKLAKLSYRSQNDQSTKNLNLTQSNYIRESKEDGFDFEKYFKDQMEGIQQFRDQDREEQKGAHLDVQKSQDFVHLDSVTTQKSLQRLVQESTLYQNNVQEPTLDPLQEWSQINSDNFTRYIPSQQPQNLHFGNNTSVISNSSLKFKSYRAPQFDKASTSHYYQNRPINQNDSNINTTSQNDDGMFTPNTRLKGDEMEEQKQFYLPNTLLKSQFTRTELNKRRNSNFSNVGQLTMQGDNQKMKGLQSIYLKKVPKPYSKHNNLSHRAQQERKTQNSNREHLVQGLNPTYRPLQHNFVDDHSQMSQMEPTNQDQIGDLDDFKTVFDGMQKAMTKIEKIRENEKQNTKKNQVQSNSLSTNDRGRLNLQRDNWLQK